MKHWIAPIAIAVLASFVCITQPAGSDDEKPVSPPPPPNMEEMMAKMAEAAKTGPEHEKMKYFLGGWTVEVDMMGHKSTGTANFAWVLEGRWMGQTIKYGMLGKTVEGFGLHGFDMYSKSHTSAFVTTSDTMMNVTRAPIVDPTGKTVVEFGVMREWMTGELDKPWKIVKKVVDQNTFTLDVWDLAAGESGAAVMNFKYTRVQ